MLIALIGKLYFLEVGLRISLKIGKIVMMGDKMIVNFSK